MDKAVVILSFLSEGGPATLAEVVEGTGLPRPTAYRLLSALEAHRLVGRVGGRYALGLRLLGWGSKAVGLDLIEAARRASGGAGGGGGAGDRGRSRLIGHPRHGYAAAANVSGSGVPISPPCRGRGLSREQA